LSALTGFTSSIPAITLGFTLGFIRHDTCNTIIDFGLSGFSLGSLMGVRSISQSRSLGQEALVFSCLQCVALSAACRSCGSNGLSCRKALLHDRVGRLRR